jgi:hypothetical protein
LLAPKIFQRRQETKKQRSFSVFELALHLTGSVLAVAGLTFFGSLEAEKCQNQSLPVPEQHLNSGLKLLVTSFMM